VLYLVAAVALLVFIITWAMVTRCSRSAIEARQPEPMPQKFQFRVAGHDRTATFDILMHYHADTEEEARVLAERAAWW